MNLQLSLKRQWFEMTKAGIKTEDYREITPYWCAILLQYEGKKMSKNFWASLLPAFDHWAIMMDIEPINFSKNIMTLGYPSKTDSSRILTYEHVGIEIREGNPEWGAVPGVKYFVIKHGKKL